MADVKQIEVNGNTYDIHDAVARADIASLQQSVNNTIAGNTNAWSGLQVQDGQGNSYRLQIENSGRVGKYFSIDNWQSWSSKPLFIPEDGSFSLGSGVTVISGDTVRIEQYAQTFVEFRLPLKTTENKTSQWAVGQISPGPGKEVGCWVSNPACSGYITAGGQVYIEGTIDSGRSIWVWGFYTLC